MRWLPALAGAALAATTTSVVAEELRQPRSQPQPLTEARAVELGLSRVDVRDWLEGRRAAAAADSRRAGQWANPEIEYSREDLDLPAGLSRETSYQVRQRFDISGRLGLERDAARQRRRADEADIELARRELTADIRRAFYEAMHATRRAAVLRQNADRLAELNRALKRRARAGDVARYDSLRMQREWSVLHGRAVTARARADAAGERLAGLIGVAGGAVSPSGGLLPPAAEDGAAWERRLADHPRLRRLARQVDAQRLTAQAAGRQAWPELTLGVGQREVSQPGVSADGDVISLGVEIPLFGRGRHAGDRAHGRARALEAEQRLLRERLSAELRGTLELIRARREAAQALEADGGDGESALTAIAERAYRAGEMSVMELLDAYRGQREAQLEALSLRLSARMAYIDLQTLTGDT